MHTITHPRVPHLDGANYMQYVSYRPNISIEISFVSDIGQGYIHNTFCMTAP